MPYEEGIVKWFDGRKGYGFIKRDGGEDIFVHCKDIEGDRTLEENDKVKFEIETGIKGFKAKKVKKI